LLAAALGGDIRRRRDKTDLATLAETLQGRASARSLIADRMLSWYDASLLSLPADPGRLLFDVALYPDAHGRDLGTLLAVGRDNESDGDKVSPDDG
jgi:hypothetical protein